MRRSKNFGDRIIDILIIIFYLLSGLEFIRFVFLMADILDIVSNTIYISYKVPIMYMSDVAERLLIVKGSLGIVCLLISLYNRSSRYLDENIKDSILMITITVIFYFLTFWA